MEEKNKLKLVEENQQLQNEEEGEEKEQKKKVPQRIEWGCNINVPFYILNENDVQKKYIMITEYISSIKHYATFNCVKYALIYHDKDTLPSGELKTAHIHLLVILPHRKRKETLINDISLFVGIEKQLVSVRPIAVFYLAYQYLVHANDIDKYQYDYNSIISNISKIELRAYEKAVSYGELTEELLIRYINESARKSDLLLKIGFKAFRKYAMIINSIWGEYHTYGEFPTPTYRSDVNKI